MKRFFILYIIAVIVGVLCIWLDYNRYYMGLTDFNGKIVVPIKYHSVTSVMPSIYYNSKEKHYYVGINLF